MSDQTAFATDSCSGSAGILPFGQALKENGLALTRDVTTSLQINLGFICNLECRHCHVEAGPNRTETMDEKTARDVISYAARSRFKTIDITGGAPEMNKNLALIIKGIRPHTDEIIVRSNLTMLDDPARDKLVNTFVENRVTIVASLPSLNQKQTESQRGEGVFARSIAGLEKLNGIGYGREGSGLLLNLVSNPVGAFFSPPQAEIEKRFKKELSRKFGVKFNNLFAMANVPLGRFGKWLETSGNLDSYYQKLADSFNPCALSGVMCKTQVSVGWDGKLFDCDFHLANKVGLGNGETYVADMPQAPTPGSPITVCDYCYTCAAGAGFTCGGAID